MVRKKKQEPLTIEQIKSKLIEETQARWIHSEPIFGLAQSNTGPTFLSLNPKTENNVTLVFLLSVAEYSTDRTFDLLDQWVKKYKKLPWTAVVCFQQKFLFLRTNDFYSRYRNHGCFSQLPLYIDPFGDFFETYGSHEEPVCAIFKDGALRSSFSLKETATGFQEVEKCLHSLLRENDPGLPLPNPGIAPLMGPTDLRVYSRTDVTLEGRWTDSTNSVATDDQKATLTCSFQGHSVRLISALHSQARETTRIHVTLNDKPIPKELHGPDLGPAEKGMNCIEIDRFGGVFDIIQSSEPLEGKLKFFYKNVIENPIIFYELRVGSDESPDT